MAHGGHAVVRPRILNTQAHEVGKVSRARRAEEELERSKILQYTG